MNYLFSHYTISEYKKKTQNYSYIYFVFTHLNHTKYFNKDRYKLEDVDNYIVKYFKGDL